MKYPTISLLLILLSTLPALTQDIFIYEPNESLVQAHSGLLFDTFIDAYIQEANDKDFYSFDVTDIENGGTFTFALVSSPNNINFHYTLFDPDGQPLIQRLTLGVGDSFTNEISICEPGVYTIYLRDGGIGQNQGSAFNADDPYRFKMDFTEFDGIDDCECENENTIQACAIEINSSLQSATIAPPFGNPGVVNNNNDRDIDVYAFNVPSPGALQAVVQVSAANIDMQGTFLNELGQSLRTKTTGVGENLTLEMSVCEAGTYYLELKDGAGGLSNGWNTEDAYLYAVIYEPFSESDPCECSPSFVASNCMINICDTVNATISAPIGVLSSSEDIDEYTFNLQENQEVDVNIFKTPELLSTKFTIIGPSGPEGTETFSGGETGDISFTTTETGEYRIRVEAQLTFAWESFDNYSFTVGCNLISSDEEILASKIHIGPNPSDGTLMIYGLSSEFDVTIYDQLGRPVYTGTQIENSLNLHDLPSGIYIVCVLIDGSKTIKRIVIN